MLYSLQVADLHATKAAGEKELAEAVARAESARAKESEAAQERIRGLERKDDETRKR